MSISSNDIQRLAAFSDGNAGGNPAGVALLAELPDEADMRRLAVEVGYSETAFVAPQAGAWRVRYFSPESEVPFCGHATIALGSALAEREGDGTFQLQLNDARIQVTGRASTGESRASLTSPPTRNERADDALVTQALQLFGYQRDDLDPSLPPLVAFAGATHLVLPLRSRQALAAMAYELSMGRDLMNAEGLVTIALVYESEPGRYDVRNAFASGGVLEDPATGAAAAAFVGALRDRGHRSGTSVTLIQGEDMGSRSIIVADADEEVGGPVRVSGTVRRL